MTVCKRVQYKGRVQGVGFRYTVQGLAAGFPVAGYVRNLANGDVELVAEGASEAVQGFLDAVARRMSAYVANQVLTEQEPARLRGFHIRY